MCLWVCGELSNALEGMKLACQKFDTRIVFLAHPRTKKRIEEFGLGKVSRQIGRLKIKEPTGYLDFLKLLANARLVLTDSGGVQQESCILRIPCVTLRDNTEWTETLQMNANVLCGTDPERIVRGVEKMLQVKREWGNPFGDGKSAARIVEIIERELSIKR